MLKKLIKIFCILTILVILNQNKIKETSYQIKINKIINQYKKENYIEINNYKLLIETGDEDEVLNKNLVYKLPYSTDNNVILAGHNNNVVFNRIYRLNKEDNILLYEDGIKHIYTVIERRCIKVNDYSIYSNKTTSKKMVLITCTKDNQKRFIVEAEEK